MIATDILDWIKKEFDKDDSYIVEIIISGIYYQGTKFYSPDQICRSILYLSENRIDRILELLLLLKTDPRNVVDAAERKAGAPGHYFNIPLSEMDNFLEKLYGKQDEPPADFWFE